MKHCTIERAQAAKGRVRRVLSRKAELVGVGITRVDEGYGVKVNLASPPAEDVELPTQVDGVPLRIEVVGAIRKRAVHAR